MLQQDPITHPIYGTAPVSSTPNNLYSNQNIPQQTPMYNQPLPQNNQFSNFQPPMQTPPDIYNPSAFNTQAVNPNAFTPNTNINHQHNVMGQVDKPQPIQKAPIPEEHVHMQTVLEEVRNRCSNAANNPVKI